MRRSNGSRAVRWRRAVVALGGTVLMACGGGSEVAEGSPPSEGHAANESTMTMPAETDTTPAATRGMVHLTTEQERALGVTYTTVRRVSVTREIRTVGQIAAPEPNIADITPKIDGFVERLSVATTGETVRRGQPLLTIYSPALVAAQEELLTARRLAARIDPSAEEAWRNAKSMLEAARRRLAYWDITVEQIDRLEQTGEVTKTMSLVAPVSGIVLEKDVFEGQRIMPGMRLYRIADLSTMWVEGEVFERDLQFVEVGAQAHIEVAAYPGEHLMGTVSFVYPTIEIESRTNRVRVTVPNPGQRLKPGMFATVFFDVAAIRDDIAVPLESVVVTGERNVVFVRDEQGMLGPRQVVLGVRANDQVQILSGLSEGETIVASANFLIDAESRLAATDGAMSMPGMSMSVPGAQRDAPGPSTEAAETPDTTASNRREGHDD